MEEDEAGRLCEKDCAKDGCSGLDDTEEVEKGV